MLISSATPWTCLGHQNSKSANSLSTFPGASPNLEAISLFPLTLHTEMAALGGRWPRASQNSHSKLLLSPSLKHLQLSHSVNRDIHLAKTRSMGHPRGIIYGERERKESTLIDHEKERQTRTPWHREGSDVPPVAHQRSAGAVTKGMFFAALELYILLTDIQGSS